MKGILLVNMGGANSPKELKVFLARMFKDPFILPMGKLVRTLLSFIISNTRYKSSWKKYELIGGSPIIEATQTTINALQNVLGDAFNVKMAFSYSSPYIKESLHAFLREGINDVTVIPLYPQASISTTTSVEADVNAAVEEYSNLKITFVKEFYKNDLFIRFWANLILNHIKENKLTNPYLVFSAHSIPMNLVEKGDTYPKAIEESSKLIADKAKLKFEFAFQSRMKGKWVGPDTKDSLKKIAETTKDLDIILIPISFVNENLETLYDLDHDIIPFAKEELKINKITRVNIPVADAQFISLLENIIEKTN